MEMIGALLIDAARKWREGIATAVGPLGLTTNSYLLLDAFDSLQRQQKTPSQSAAARLARMDVNVTAQAMKYLVQHHLINRTLSTIDSRSYVVTLTLAGSQQLRLARAAVAHFEKVYFADLALGHFAEALRSLTK